MNRVAVSIVMGMCLCGAGCMRDELVGTWEAGRGDSMSHWGPQNIVDEPTNGFEAATLALRSEGSFRSVRRRDGAETVRTGEWHVHDRVLVLGEQAGKPTSGDLSGGWLASFDGAGRLVLTEQCADCWVMYTFSRGRGDDAE